MNPPAIGILGGTFDPIHYGHLRLAQEVAQTLALTQVRFMPAGVPPLRGEPRSHAAHRVAMVRMAIADNPLFSLDDRETRRSGPSYTFDTLTQLRAELGAATPLTWIVGLDAFLRFDHWHRWFEIFDVAHIAVAHRPGAALSDIGDTVLAAEFAVRRVDDFRALSTRPAGCVAVLPIPLLQISATAIRAAIGSGRSVRYWLPDAVIEYINAQHLFS